MNTKIKSSRIIPKGVDIITTANKLTVGKSGIINPNSSTVAPVQEIVAIGPSEHAFNIGDLVEILPESFPKTASKLPKNGVGADIPGTPIIPLYELEDMDVLIINSRNILWGVKPE